MEQSTLRCGSTLSRGLEKSILQQAGIERPGNDRPRALHDTILLERARDGGWGAWSPELPGCVALGDSFDCVAEMREAIAFHLEGLVEGGEAIPEPSGPGVYISAEPAEISAG